MGIFTLLAFLLSDSVVSSSISYRVVVLICYYLITNSKKSNNASSNNNSCTNRSDNSDNQTQYAPISELLEYVSVIQFDASMDEVQDFRVRTTGIIKAISDDGKAVFIGDANNDRALPCIMSNSYLISLTSSLARLVNKHRCYNSISVTITGTGTHTEVCGRPVLKIQVDTISADSTYASDMLHAAESSMTSTDDNDNIFW